MCISTNNKHVIVSEVFMITGNIFKKRKKQTNLTSLCKDLEVILGEEHLQHFNRRKWFSFKGLKTGFHIHLCLHCSLLNHG